MAVAHFQMLVIFSTHNFHFLETFSTCFVSASVARCRHVPPSELRFNLDEMTFVFLNLRVTLLLWRPFCREFD